MHEFDVEILINKSIRIFVIQVRLGKEFGGDYSSSTVSIGNSRAVQPKTVFEFLEFNTLGKVYKVLDDDKPTLQEFTVVAYTNDEPVIVDNSRVLVATEFCGYGTEEQAIAWRTDKLKEEKEKIFKKLTKLDELEKSLKNL